MDPYLARIIALLGKDDPLASLAAMPRRLEELLPQIEPEKPYAPGKWSAREILCHLADTEMALGFRFRQILAQDNPTVQPFDQDAWAARYGGLPMELAYDAFRALRAWNLALLRGLSEGDLARSYYHPEREEWESLHLLVRFLAGHDLNHLGQLEVIASQSARG
ncbi:putative metal-dependent hydrolase YfiT [Calidithermus terrae]|uniref:Putative metal-dependent hydrolase YfiT n=1 Tax=Calidithermus terrae TaxID=1408545 RepID=A0A399EE38_9DEIN|nr:DinB family protein [Calidithermus terrae]RIH82066.1 putative metal-dependent hydrolase YfiT [Calidithermus terrae]